MVTTGTIYSSIYKLRGIDTSNRQKELGMEILFPSLPIVCGVGFGPAYA